MSVYELTSIPTVLVVGAGAAIGYGLPLGRQLLDELRIRPLYELPCATEFDGQSYRTHNRGRAIADAFQSAIRTPAARSIDLFLEENEDFSTLGKEAIAYILNEKESHAISRLGDGSQWYLWLYDQLAVTKRGVDFGELSIITFNYDRTIELGLAMMCANRTRQAEGRRSAMAYWAERCDWPIFHVHGHLDGEVQQYADERCLRVQQTRRDIAASANTIRVINDQRARESEQYLANVRQRIWNAYNIVFLGFGFDRVNLERIGIGPAFESWEAKSRTVRGTLVGLENQEITDIQDFLGPSKILIGTDGQQVTCERLLRQLFRARMWRRK